MRDLIEERRWQRIREEVDKLGHPAAKQIYMQSPLLRFLMTASPKELVKYRRRFLADQETAGNIRR